MKRIDTSTRAVNLFGTGKDGFKNGNLGTGDPPTDLNADWFNGAQEELMNVIESVSLTPSGGDLTQLLQAIRAIAGGPGRVAAFARASAPAGWLSCNGAAVSRSTYAALFAVIGTTFGVGDGSTTFNLPDMRGEFIRGWDDGRGVDSGRALGSGQASQNASHSHGVNDPGHGHSVNDPGHGHSINDPGHHHQWGRNEQNGTSVGAGNLGQTGTGNAADTSHVGTGISINGSGTGISINGSLLGISIQSSGGSEARPRNVALLYCISIF